MTFRMAKCHFTMCFWCAYQKNCHFTSCLWHLWIFDVIFSMFLTLSNFEVVFYMCFRRFRKAKCHFTRCFWYACTKNCHFTSCVWHLLFFYVIFIVFLTLWNFEVSFCMHLNHKTIWKTQGFHRFWWKSDQNEIKIIAKSCRVPSFLTSTPKIVAKNIEFLSFLKMDMLKD